MFYSKSNLIALVQVCACIDRYNDAATKFNSLLEEHKRLWGESVDLDEHLEKLLSENKRLRRKLTKLTEIQKPKTRSKNV